MTGPLKLQKNNK